MLRSIRRGRVLTPISQPRGADGTGSGSLFDVAAERLPGVGGRSRRAGHRKFFLHALPSYRIIHTGTRPVKSLRQQRVRIAIPNELAALPVASDTLKRFGADNGVPHRVLVQLQVALDEIVSNIIKYAWPEGGSHELTICLTAHSGAVEIEIVDDGREFDPLSVPSPVPVPKGRRPRPGGVGIHMTRKLIDGIEYARSNGQNHIIL